MKAWPSLFLLPVMIGCQPPAAEVSSTLTQAEKEQIADEVIEWTDEWFETMEALDIEANLALHDQPNLTWSTGGVMLKSWGEYEPWIRGVFQQWEEWDGEWTHRVVNVFTRNDAMVRAQSSDVVTMASGRQARWEDTWTFLLRKVDGRWLVSHGHASGSSSPAGE